MSFFDNTHTKFLMAVRKWFDEMEAVIDGNEKSEMLTEFPIYEERRKRKSCQDRRDEKDDELMFPCPFCNLYFSSFRSMMLHKYIHDFENVF